MRGSLIKLVLNFFEYLLYLKVSLHLWGRVCVLWSSFSVIREWMAVSNCAFLSNCRLDSISVCCLQTRKKGEERGQSASMGIHQMSMKKRKKKAKQVLLFFVESSSSSVWCRVQRQFIGVPSSSSLLLLLSLSFPFSFRRWQKWEQ